ncbi:Na+-translocating NADH-quinone reductase subunit C [Kiritimatiella glycovorans]|uniref:Na(+)-translocating NADH-quinone reductase subunit C n=1 Tax=Kiritimatiella glycovorans TaxID=1307763 RepID=A0A0G3EBM2_9BACT|nr:Na+-translocating NADH-quinone reductase subunit C [Kiritimatiella glycovorans]AKJ63851.1 Na(+)-translocating NADH-quinone reductase subunit C [Kiritimatiella glycovorans]
MRDDVRTILFALAVCLVCSLVLSGTAAALRERQRTNILLDRQKNILKALGVPLKREDGAKLGAGDVQRLFAEHMKTVWLDADTAEPVGPERRPAPEEDGIPPGLRPVYIWERAAAPRYVVPIRGRGLWGMMYGYLALDSGLSTIGGLTFYKHNETPGLGAEIEKSWFQEQFEGKRLYRDGDPVDFEVVKGGVERKFPDGSPRAVDAISGATKTSVGVEETLRSAAKNYDAYFDRLRDRG